MEVLKVKRTKGGYVATLTMVDGVRFRAKGKTRPEAVRNLNAGFLSWSMNQNSAWE